jgi:hypothetical protein
MAENAITDEVCELESLKQAGNVDHSRSVARNADAAARSRRGGCPPFVADATRSAVWMR